jgi:hopanoid biosynthesis associated protein HpnK
MSKLLIVNADDFGLEEEINAGIVEAHARGVVTTTSLMANGAAFEQAVELARANPSLDVGAHLALTRGPSLVGGPLLEPREVPGLVKGDGLFSKSPVALGARLALGLVSPLQIRKELRAQMEKIRATGLRITHVDGHQHVHLMPQVFRVVVELAREFDVKWLRLPARWLRPGEGPGAGASRRLQGGLLSGLAARNRRAMERAGLRSADYYAGFDFAGRLLEDEIERIIETLPDGVVELSCHPGSDDARLSRNHPWGYGWRRELEALCSSRMREAVEKSGARLIGYSSVDSAL